MTQTLVRTTSEPHPEIKERLLDAALIHVAFDGWSDATFRAACRDAGVDLAVGRVICPRGGVDLALAYHERGDRIMLEQLALEDLPTMRLRDRIMLAIRLRIEAIDDKEAVRRGSTLLTLPQYAADGARAIWTTADRIWSALGDSSDDINWYSKRASLSAVYSSTVLYWLGDDSEGNEATWAFLERRVEDVLRVEKMRAQVTGNPVLKRLFAGPNWLLGKVRAPGAGVTDEHMPGHWSEPGESDEGVRGTAAFRPR
ncbi:COQ9 family protein [Tropicimonas sediminicola]|uniref:Ubiquinone biosynthesis protein COQ9 n=1 Tax=Tropicimonas sediminicola TaxID=1031541 RepID=A0A239I6E5_9RHOB|nr:COQ9 family protein [Tropicimonas sediminicola]SNS89127.1 ubiquinone biosynthesis protein COQ9 [Tropicimonas sediminicola]